jgi:hypothetical protein
MTTPTIKPHALEIAIGAALGAGAGLAVASTLLVLTHTPAATLWPPGILASPNSWLRLQAGLLLGSTLVGGGWGGFIAARQKSEQHVRGTLYLPHAGEALDALQDQERGRMSKAQRSGKIHGLTIGGLELARQSEVGHGLIVAQPNSGKTTVLADALDHTLARGDKALLHDPKSEFIVTHYRDGGEVVILGPWDARASIWSPSDIDTPALADEFASSVCGAAEAKGPNAYFHVSAAAILAGLIKSYMLEDGAQWSWSDLTRWIEAEPIAMIRRAATGDGRVRQVIPGAFPPARKDGTPAAPRLSGGENSVISTLASSATLLQQIAAVDRERPDALRFSFRRWLLDQDHQQVRLVILNSSAEYATASAALWGAMLSTISATISARMPNLDPDSPGALWLLLDEFPQLGASGIGKMLTIAEVGRSRGCRVWAALQNESQLAARMGIEAAAPVLSMAGTRIYLKCSDDDASTVSRRYGDREIQRIETTASQGAVQGKRSTHEKLPAILPAELTALIPDATGVWLILGRGALLGKLHHAFGARRPKIAEAYLEAQDWRTGTLPPKAPAPADPVPDGSRDCAPTLDEPEPSPLDDLSPHDDLSSLPAPDRQEPDAGLDLDAEWRE